MNPKICLLRGRNFDTKQIISHYKSFETQQENSFKADNIIKPYSKMQKNDEKHIHTARAFVERFVLYENI